jgi:two-component system chemotaxis sensor kinase CheA
MGPEASQQPNSLEASLEAASKAAVLTDSADLQGLVSLSETLRRLTSDAERAGATEIAGRSAEAADLAESIVLRQVDDVERAFRAVIAAIEACETTAARAAAPRREPTDPELLMAWVASCDSTIPEIEHLAVRAEREGFVGETAAELRRRIHTLKGECGVLSLSTAQALCHEVESVIDASGNRFPIEATLALCDWMRSLTAALAGDACAAEPDPACVIAALRATSESTESNPGPSAIATPPSQPTSQPTATHPASAQASAAPAPAPRATHTPTAPSAAASSNTTTATTTTSTASEPDPLADLLALDPSIAASMPIENADENLGDFATEAREHLANAENAVLSLEANPHDAELVNVVFRAFHTIKGVAGFLNLGRIVEVAHAAEFLLDKVRSNKLPLSAHVLELVLASSDLLGQLIGMLSGGDAPKERELRILVRRLEFACQGREVPAPGAPTRPARAEESSERAEPGADDHEEPCVETAEVAASAPTVPAPTAREGSGDAPIAAAPQTSPATAAKVTAHLKADQTVKVSTQRMDALVNLVGELVIAQLMVVQDPEVSRLHDQRVQRNLAHLGKIVRDLQETSMSLRMVTLKSTFQKMARLVRDVAAKAGKRIQLEVEGEDVELDRNVVEEIGDPLVHMIRNACDHGVEPADERRRVGKPETGTLKLRAFHSGGSIVIEVSDDGRGLSRERIIRKCLEKGLLDTSRNTDEIPDSEVFNYIFLPGFSTAEKVTDISGRGVGMDVVRRNIEALRGSVEIRSTPGQGSVFSMRLPLTMAIIDGMVVRVGSQRYVVPTLNIERSFRPTGDQITTVLGKGEVVRVRDGLLPIYRLRRIFELSEGSTEFSDGLLLVLENGKRRACVFVDEILGQQQVVIKSLGESRPQIRGVSGGAILGDGRVALIVDVGGLLEEATNAAA